MHKKTYNKEFEEIFTRYYPKIRTFAAILLKSDQEAEDVAQDIFLKLWEEPHLWENNLEKNYLYTIVKNYVFNRIKRKKFESEYVNSQKIRLATEEVTDFKDPLNELYLEELQLLLKLSLEQMPDKRRRAFEMSRFERLSNREIAEKLKLSVRTVEQHIYLTLKDLKKLFMIALFLMKF